MSAQKMAIEPAAERFDNQEAGSVTRAADEAARRAQARAGITIRQLETVEHMREAAEVYQAIWGRRFDMGPPMNADLLRALGHAGNYVAGAFDEAGKIHGALVGFLGERSGHIHLHSHILGVLPDSPVRGAGFALKLHQRWWALERGHDMIQWTFDPLVRRNGHFNLTKLGTQVERYFVNFYGVMDDSQNHQDDSDRILLTWDLGSPRTVSAAAGSPLDVEALVDETRTQRVLGADEAGNPALRSVARGPELLLVHVPADIVKMRAGAPAQAHRWREALREALVTAFDAGYACEGMTRSGDYVLSLTAGS